ncbi:hypothetical protein HDV00_000283 [Rhizophlyctis rosea]|nr:hypothetical protein HDV00_000283 [Rhizophlyctis rosea]
MKSKLEASFPAGCAPTVWDEESWRDMAGVAAAWSRPWSTVKFVKDPPIHVSPYELANLPPTVIRRFVCSKAVSNLPGWTNVNSSGIDVWYLRALNLRETEICRTDLLRQSSEVLLAKVSHPNADARIYQVRRSHWQPVINDKSLAEGGIWVEEAEVCSRILKTVHHECADDDEGEDEGGYEGYITTFWRMGEDEGAPQQTSVSPNADVPNLATASDLTELWWEPSKSGGNDVSGPDVEFYFNETVAVQRSSEYSHPLNPDDKRTQVHVHLIVMRLTDQETLGETKYTFFKEQRECYTLTRTHFFRFHDDCLVDVMSLPSLTVLHTLNLGNSNPGHWSMSSSDDDSLLFLTKPYEKMGPTTLMLDARNQTPFYRGDDYQPRALDGFYVVARDYLVEKEAGGAVEGSAGSSAKSGTDQAAPQLRVRAGCAYVDTVYFRQNPSLWSDDLSDDVGGSADD